MNKAVVVLGSPRKNGNSTLLAQKAMQGIEAAGGSCKTFYLNGMNIRPCQACDACKRYPEKRCVQRDDMHAIYDALEESDILLMAAPIYMFTVSAQLKLFMDRCYAVFSALKGKRVGVIFTYGGNDESDSGAINAINTMKDEFSYAEADIIGIVHGSADGPGEIAANARVMDEAFALGKALVQQ